jgi:ABC-type multidrug transport system ATPase subunit
MTETLIAVTNLQKHFGTLKAVDDLSFEVQSGQVYGFLGQNGAGKSTTIRMLLTLVQPTSGSIRLFGQSLTAERHSILRQVGAVIERADLYKYLTAYENLRIMAKLSGSKPDNKELLRNLDRVGLLERAHSKVRTFSQGMKQRLGIACALVHEPKLIVLDEPTNGLDPQGIADIRNLILHLSHNEGKTVFVSSHLLSEIELVADSMLIIDKGRKVAEGKVKELLNPAETIVLLHTTNDEAAAQWLLQSGWSKAVQPGSDGISLQLHSNSIPQLNRDLVGAGIGVLSLQSRHSLEAYFLSLTTSNQHVATYAH